MIGTSGGTGETKGLFGINSHAGGWSVSGELLHLTFVL